MTFFKRGDNVIGSFFEKLDWRTCLQRKVGLRVRRLSRRSTLQVSGISRRGSQLITATYAVVTVGNTKPSDVIRTQGNWRRFFVRSPIWQISGARVIATSSNETRLVSRRILVQTKLLIAALFQIGESLCTR